MSDDIEKMQDSFELEALKSKISQLEAENDDLRKTLRVYGIEESEKVSDIEAICVKQLRLFREMSDSGIPLSNDDAKIVDIMHKNLKMALGKEDKKSPKGKEYTVGELISIVEAKEKKESGDK
jgi:hypothetical protein